MAKKTILIVEDEVSSIEILTTILEYEGFAIRSASTVDAALAVASLDMIDAVLLDLWLPTNEEQGFQVLDRYLRRDPDLPIIVTTAHGSFDAAIRATKLGAFDFLAKPVDRDRLLLALRNAVERRHLRRETRRMKELSSRETKILGNSPAILSLLETIEKVGPTDASVLITGENGTGKELVAQAIHTSSRRRNEPFIEVNCAAIPKELIESELFGHEKGSFTGATNQYIGKFEQADTGTIFLDEVGDMSLEAQAKVLRVIENQKVERVGGSGAIAIDVRVVAATNKDLIKEIEQKTFREDLFHRLNVIPIHVPPLRERPDDIPLLAAAFIEALCQRNGIRPKSVTSGAQISLRSREWRGNVRELRNVVERLIIMSRGDEITEEDVTALAPKPVSEFEDILASSSTLDEFQDRSEAVFIRRKLDAHDWNVTKTAEAIGIQRSHLYTKMDKYGLKRTERR